MHGILLPFRRFTSTRVNKCHRLSAALKIDQGQLAILFTVGSFAFRSPLTTQSCGAIQRDGEIPVGEYPLQARDNFLIACDEIRACEDPVFRSGR